MYRYAKQEVANNGQALPLDVCFTLRTGNDARLYAGRDGKNLSR